MSITCEPADAVALLGQVTDLLGRLNQVPLWKLANDQTLELLRSYQTASSMLASAKLKAIAEVDSRGTAITEGAASTAGWIRGHCRERMGVAKRQVSLARALRQDYPETGAALASGGIGADAAQVVVKSLRKVPDCVDEATLAAAEANLHQLATVLDPADLAKAGRRIVFCLDPDGAAEMAREEAKMVGRRELFLTRDETGFWRIRGRLDPERGAELHVAIQALAKPKPSTADGPDLRTTGQRNADALADLVSLALASDGLPSTGGHQPLVIIQIPLATLQGKPGAGPATFTDGTPLSPEAARRIACDAKASPSSSVAAPSRSMPAAPPATPPSPSGCRFWPGTITAARPRTAGTRPGTSTTSGTGPTSDPPTWTTWSPCVGTATASYTPTTTTGPSPPYPAAHRCSPEPAPRPRPVVRSGIPPVQDVQNLGVRCRGIVEDCVDDDCCWPLFQQGQQAVVHRSHIIETTLRLGHLPCLDVRRLPGRASALLEPTDRLVPPGHQDDLVERDFRLGRDLLAGRTPRDCSSTAQLATDEIDVEVERQRVALRVQQGDRRLTHAGWTVEQDQAWHHRNVRCPARSWGGDADPPATLEDGRALAELLRVNREFLAPWDPIRGDDYYTDDGQLALLREALDGQERGTALTHVILAEDGRVVGRITLSGIVRGPFQSCSVGYWVAASDNGRGLATAALAHLKQLAFGELGLHRIEAGALLHNVRSQRVLERNGFVRFGVAPEYLSIAGRWQDHVMYQVLSR